MKICIAQIKPLKGDIKKNIEIHKIFIDKAVSYNSDIIFFPELSLTSYEPELANNLAISETDNNLYEFQYISNLKNISICMGIPTKNEKGIFISMIIFQPNKQKKIYSKQYLHEDELPYFVNGNKQIILNIKNEKIAPAICYESLLNEHIEKVMEENINVYIASVAKHNLGVEKALKFYSEIAKKYSVYVLMTNFVGECDNFICSGTSSVWNKEGKLLDQLDNLNQGILIFDTETEQVKKLI